MLDRKQTMRKTLGIKHNSESHTLPQGLCQPGAKHSMYEPVGHTSQSNRRARSSPCCARESRGYEVIAELSGEASSSLGQDHRT